VSKPDDIPEWVQVWRWARTQRKPLEQRPFPQQDAREHGGQSMTNAEYQALAEEWRTDGKTPSSLNDILNELTETRDAA
jgi:hypothetical protein